MKYRLHKADIIFVPYNYIINPEICKNMGLSLKNKIIIFDEAHNAAQAAENAYNKEITLQEINIVIDVLLTLEMYLKD